MLEKPQSGFHLGVHYGHNATVAVVKDGEVIFCQSEERLNRIKNSVGMPWLTLDFIFSEICAPDEVESVSFFQKSIFGYLYLRSHNFESHPYHDYLTPGTHRSGRIASGPIRERLAALKARITNANTRLRRESLDFFARATQVSPHKLNFVDHHAAHAYSAAGNTFGRGRTLVFTLDGEGDGLCSSVGVLDNGMYSRLSSSKRENSLGLLYSLTTGILGMKPNEHEFKVMGLAPYANSDRAQTVLTKIEPLLVIDRQGKFAMATRSHETMRRLEEIYRFQRFDSVAWAIQTHTENLIRQWVRYWIMETGIASIAVAGGVFMNVKACQVVSEMKEVSDLFVVPSAADESTAIGSAWLGNLMSNPSQTLKPLQNLYLGSEWREDYLFDLVTDASTHSHFNVGIPEDLAFEVARLLANNEIVARFSGRLEFGARALGNRSILANPSDFANVEILNAAIKNRDFWMPFTPSILEEDMHLYVEKADRIAANYMCITFNSTPLAQEHLRAAIHPRDKTVRPQSVIKDWNPEYHAIIQAFKGLTGIGGVLNTSFNLHGEPNVGSPEDALRTVRNSGLRHLVLGPYLLSKK